jgi:DNA processing protein
MAQEMMGDLFHRLLIFRSKGIGAIKYHELIENAGGVEQAVELLQISGDLIDSVRKEMDLANSLGIKYITDDSPEFPDIYKSVRNHSPILSVRGNIKTLSKRTIGIVGTRQATAAGIKFTSELANVFSSNNFAVVSGMAMGTDTAAHNGALISDGDTQTIAVLAGGADYIWPLENEKLYWEIVERGAIISDMPVGFIPVANNFIARNRIVAGISENLILGEADEKSGSVATANFSIEYGRKLWAIPSHPSDERSVGPNRFIQKGLAKLCMGSDDFFQTEENLRTKKETKYSNSDLLNLIGSVPVSESVLTVLAKKNISETMSDLVMLELNGFIKKTDTGYVRV